MSLFFPSFFLFLYFITPPLSLPYFLCLPFVFPSFPLSLLCSSLRYFYPLFIFFYFTLLPFIFCSPSFSLTLPFCMLFLSSFFLPISSSFPSYRLPTYASFHATLLSYPFHFSHLENCIFRFLSSYFFAASTCTEPFESSIRPLHSVFPPSSQAFPPLISSSLSANFHILKNILQSPLFSFPLPLPFF